MIAGMKSVCAVNDCSLMAFSGIGAIRRRSTASRK
jgi:hypothetical protein